ncbi:hypothetical protein BZA77DRAFT_118680 [Pyronema omphalodes]|nr:hypothetical protein BZA77DRAFT_118680 [Pyronema omphalodes]
MESNNATAPIQTPPVTQGITTPSPSPAVPNVPTPTNIATPEATNNPAPPALPATSASQPQSPSAPPPAPSSSTSSQPAPQPTPTSSTSEAPSVPAPAPTSTTAGPSTVDSVVTKTNNSTVTFFSTQIVPSNTAVPAPTANPTSSQTIASDIANASNISSVDGGSGGQLNPTAKVVIAVVVPIVGVALIAIALLFFWKKRRRDKEMVAEQRRKEVEDYSFNPNSPAGAMITGGANSSNGDDTPYNMSESAGYRGWGSTNGGRKVPIGASVGSAPAFSPVGMAYAENTYMDSNGYNGIAPSPGAPSTDGGMSNAPLINSSQGNRPGTADSDPTIGGVAGGIIGNGQGPKNADHEGIRRGISNASSNYSAMTVSDNSDGMPPGPYDAQYYATDGGYDEGHNYSGPYQQYPDAAYVPPVIREVSARRNTQIETPASHHYPQQGNSGIAQNF